MPISPPDVSVKRELARKLFDAVVSGVPLVGGPLAALWSVTHPSKTDIAEDEWRAEISLFMNDLEAALKKIAGGIELSKDAAFLGKWLSENAETGHSDIFDHQRLNAAFPSASKNELLEAIGELELEGLIQISGALGVPFSHIRLEAKFYEVFDPVAFDNASPRDDAATIALAVLDNDRFSAEQFVRESGWTIRRVNPALGLVVEFICPRRVSNPIGQPLAARSLFADAAERAALRRFVRQVRGFEEE